MPDEANLSDFQKESFWLAKRVLLEGKRSPFEKHRL